MEKFLLSYLGQSQGDALWWGQDFFMISPEQKFPFFHYSQRNQFFLKK